MRIPADAQGDVMYEFETFAYLEVPKTASTFICTALKVLCTEKKIRKTGHFGPPKDYDPAKFHFISVRDPLDLYISLYSFGCNDAGALRVQMNRQGLSGLYDRTWSGFEFWLKFILSPANKSLLDPEYQRVADWVGFQSYRVLSHAIPDFAEAAKTCNSAQDLRRLYEERNVAAYTVRYESLRRDLCTLFNGRLRDSMRWERAAQYVLGAPPLNRSERIDHFMPDPQLGAKIRKILDRREWLLRDYFGYGAQPTKRPNPGIGSSLIPVDRKVDPGRGCCC